MKITTTSSDQDTIRYGKDLVSNLQGGDILLLEGNLGAGKTTLAKGIALGLNIKNKITSPTFSLMNVYDVNNKNIKQLVHIDTYRLESENDLTEIGVEDYLGDVNTICIIEWPEKIKNLLDNLKTKKIKIAHIDEQNRKITFEK